MNAARQSRNWNGARTFLSAATHEGRKALDGSGAMPWRDVAADRNVRAPLPLEISSPLASKLRYCSAK